MFLTSSCSLPKMTLGWSWCYCHPLFVCRCLCLLVRIERKRGSATVLSHWWNMQVPNVGRFIMLVTIPHIIDGTKRFFPGFTLCDGLCLAYLPTDLLTVQLKAFVRSKPCRLTWLFRVLKSAQSLYDDKNRKVIIHCYHHNYKKTNIYVCVYIQEIILLHVPKVTSNRNPKSYILEN